MALNKVCKRIIYVDRESMVTPAIHHLLQQPYLGFDTETWNCRDRKVPAFNPIEGSRIRLSQWATPDGISYVFDHFRISKSYLYMMFPNPMLIVGQNLKFDVKHLIYELDLDEFGDMYDTMIAGQIVTRGRISGEDSDGSYVPVGLDDLAMRELQLELPKDEQKSDWHLPVLSEKQIQYAGQDAYVVLPIMEKQTQHLKDFGQVRAAEIDFDVIPAVADMELNGMRLDVDKWKAAAKIKSDEREQIQERLWAEFGSQGTLFEGVKSINLSAPQEVIKAFKRRDLPVPRDPKTNKESVDIKLLKPYENAYPIIKDYRAYKGLTKLLDSYGPGFSKYVSDADGRIHAQYKIIGAKTGRMACSGPNLQQVPRDDAYRNSLVANEGWVLVGYDYSQCELRILAEYCLDPNYLYAFDEDLDLHKYTASLIFMCAMEEVSGKQRAIAKNINFGIVYGIGVAKFAQDAGISEDEARAIMDLYLIKTYPFMKKWLDGRASQVLSDRRGVSTMAGRKWTNPPGDLSDKKFRSQVQRNAKNFGIQGTNGDMTKRAMALLYKAIKPYRRGIKIVHVVHDEIICECLPQYVRICKQLLEQCMLKAEREYLKRVPSKVDGDVTLCWSKEASEEQKQEAQDLIYESIGEYV